jgi:hypothetical protein
MKLFKKICQFVIICYIACVLTKIIMNKFTFNTDYLFESLFITFGITLGWFAYDYFQSKKNKK